MSFLIGLQNLIDYYKLVERQSVMENSQIKKLDSFPAEDGHIESVLIGVQVIKVSFQDWMGRRLVIIFQDALEFQGYDSGEQSILYQDIGEFSVRELENELKEYRFVGSWDDKAFLSIKAKSIEIFEVGVITDWNTALFEMDLEYIGGQPVM